MCAICPTVFSFLSFDVTRFNFELYRGLSLISNTGVKNKTTMLPRRSSSSTNQRRSSILKPPKTRQPFQDLDFNTSSPDISPESTKKRRVSFAEKKHVKEFCDHKEQGTIWDSTYEEADQSASKSTEISCEHAEVINTDLDNIEIEMKEAGYGFLQSHFEHVNTEPCVTMDSQSVANSSLRRKQFESGNNDFELTGIIPCSQEIQNNLMSQTMYCQEDDLEITEAIGGIEPTVPLKPIHHSQAREIASSNGTERGTKFTENTMLFENSDCEINFTEVVSTQKPQASTPLIMNDFPKLEADADSFVENQTIIFEDSVMELTLTESPLSKSDKNEQGGECEIRKNGVNKTIIFNDMGCEMTEAIKTVSHRMPEIDKENLGVHIQTERSPGIPNSNDDITIFFDDFQCEMTEAINLIRHCPIDDENVEVTKDIEQVVPSKMENVTLGNITSEFTAADNNEKGFLDKSAMEFAVAFTREQNGQIETQQSSPGGVLKQTSEPPSKLVTKVEENIECLNESSMEFTIALQSTCANVKNRAEEETHTLKKGETLVYEDSDSDIREAVFIAPCISNPVPNSVEPDCSSSNEFESGDQQRKKRKSDEITKGVDGKSSPDTMLSKNVELLVQNLVPDDNLSNQSAPGCKRLKIGKDATQEHTSSHVVDPSTSNAKELRNLSSKKTIDVPMSKTQEIPDTESENPIAVFTLNCAEDEEKLVVNESKELEKEEVLETNDNSIEGECSFAKSTLSNLDNDSESDMLEFSRVYEKQRQSIIKENEDVESCLKPDDKSPDRDDDCYFVMFSEELEKHANSDDCIWKIRSIDKKEVLIDFISKSFVVVICLEETEDLTTLRIIKEIKIISLLPDSADANISMVHNIVLKKLDPESLRRKHRTTQDVLRLLEFISNKLKLAMDFMYEFEKLQDLHLMIRRGNRISFRLHSYKVTLAIKITIDIEPLEDIGPNDVKVECILGNIREKDIKELIIGVKKDHKFLTNYIKDIKEYIALLVEK